MGSRSTPATLFLDRSSIPYTAHEYELAAEGPTYGEAVAATLGVPPGRLFKTLIAEVDGKPVAAIVPVDRQLSLKALAAAAGGKRARMADPDDAERWTGYVTGGISPFGQKKRLRTFLDASAEACGTLYVSGGRRGLQIELAPGDLARAAEARVVAGLGA